MLMKKILLSMFLLIVFHFKMNAQVDPHFSQYYVYPAWLNPALTGAIDGDYRASAIFRKQWGGIDGFSTSGISADMVTNNSFNVGAALMQQKAGVGGYTFLTGNLSLAYTGIKFDAAGLKRLVFAMQGGILDRRFDRSKFTLGDQWNPITGYNPSVISADILAKNISTVFDMGAGVLYYDASPFKKANVFIGFSAAHITQPEDPFTDGAIKSKLPVRYTLHGGIKFNINEALTIVPNLLYLRQGNAEEKMIGGYAQIKGNSYFDFLAGANYRVNDAVVTFVGFNYKNITMGLSYDVATSDLARNINNINSFELSLSCLFRKSKTLPSGNFVCPRL